MSISVSRTLWSKFPRGVGADGLGLNNSVDAVVRNPLVFGARRIGVMSLGPTHGILGRTIAHADDIRSIRDMEVWKMGGGTGVVVDEADVGLYNIGYAMPRLHYVLLVIRERI